MNPQKLGTKKREKRLQRRSKWRYKRINPNKDTTVHNTWLMNKKINAKAEYIKSKQRVNEEKNENGIMCIKE